MTKREEAVKFLRFCKKLNKTTIGIDIILDMLWQEGDKDMELKTYKDES